MKKLLFLIGTLLLITGTVSAKWLGFKAFLQSDKLENALAENALLMSGFYPSRDRLTNTYTILESVDAVTRGAFDDELLVEIKPGVHKISCKYEGPRTIKGSVGKKVTILYHFEKGKIYIPCGVILGRKWLLELKEYASVKDMNPKSIKRIQKAFRESNESKAKRPWI